MRNKILSSFVVAAISCSSLVLLADETVQINNPKNVEATSIKNLISDAIVTISIKKQCLMDDKLNKHYIHIGTLNGAVTLTGALPDEKVRTLLVSIARSTIGVREVLVDINIANDSTILKANNDAVINGKIKLLFLDDANIYATNIHVKTINNNVILTGKAPNESIKNRAIMLAQTTQGIKSVLSSIEVDKSITLGSATDRAITSMIQLRLFEDEELNNLEINVKTVNGDVMLSGEVPSSILRERVMSIVKNINGVKKILPKFESQ